MKFTSFTLSALLATGATAFSPSSIATRSGTNSAVASTASLESALFARKPFISGNWKMNPSTPEEAITLAKEISEAVTSDSPDADVALFVPYVFLSDAMKAAQGKVMIGAEVRLVEPPTGMRPARPPHFSAPYAFFQGSLLRPLSILSLTQHTSGRLP